MKQSIHVMPHGNIWKMKCDHCMEQLYHTQSEAIEAARLHVATSPEGILQEIRVQTENGEWRVEWSYENDPFPSKE